MVEFASICEKLELRLSPATEVLLPGKEIKQAAVALILRQYLGIAELLIIKRAPASGDYWSGNLALPGGRHQANDANLCATALRETFEEVGIDCTSGGRVLGCLDTIETTNPQAPKVAVTPFVTIAPPAYHQTASGMEPPALTLNYEVATGFWVPLSLLREKGRSEVFRLIIEDQEREWVAYPTVHGPIWGMTERILTSFLALLD